MPQPVATLDAGLSKIGIDRRQLGFLLGAAGVVTALPAGASSQCERLVVSTWGGDFAKSLEEIFASRMTAEAAFVADVGNASTRKSRLLAERARPNGSADIVCLDSIDMHQMAEQGLLHPVAASDVPNIANVLPEFQRNHSVPQAYSAKVIVYNPEKMRAPGSFRDLWKGDYAGKIGLADLLALAVIESAALISGGSATNYEPGKAKLLELKAAGVKLYPSNESLAAALKSGEIWATIMWRARALQWQSAGLPVAYSVPEEGATPITFEIAMARNAPNKACAANFLNAALDPAAQVAFATRMGYCPTVVNAKLPAELAAKVEFTPEQRARFFKQDFAYIDKNQAQLIDWWTREFKG